MDALTSALEKGEAGNTGLQGSKSPPVTAIAPLNSTSARFSWIWDKDHVPSDVPPKTPGLVATSAFRGLLSDPANSSHMNATNLVGFSPVTCLEGASSDRPSEGTQMSVDNVRLLLDFEQHSSKPTSRKELSCIYAPTHTRKDILPG